MLNTFKNYHSQKGRIEMSQKKMLSYLLFLLTFLFIYSSPFGQKQLRIVSLAPNWTNTVAAIGAAENLVGVTLYCIFPDSIPKLVKEGKLEIIGGFADISLEKVRSLKPDLILTCTGIQNKFRDLFIEEGFNVIHMEETSLNEVYDKILELGEAINKQIAAEKLVDEIKLSLNNVSLKYQDSPKVSVYYEINYFYKCVPGKDSYITELLKAVGGNPIFCDRPGIAPKVSWDEVVKANPDVILIPIWDNARGPFFEGEKVGWGTTTPYEIAHREDAQNVNAVKYGKVRYINSAKTKQAGPHIPIAAELFGKTIHAAGDLELLKIDKVPENMETTFSQLIEYFPLYNYAFINMYSISLTN
jgi:iron complex transport system substrate-binding protein